MLLTMQQVKILLNTSHQVLIELDNGQYALYPNNRMRIFDNSLTPVDPKMPYFKVSTQYYSVENGYERLGMGREDEYFGKQQKNAKFYQKKRKMTPNNDFLDNLGNDQHQKMLREISNDDITPKKRDTKKKSEIYEINDVDSTIDPMILNEF